MDLKLTKPKRNAWYSTTRGRLLRRKFYFARDKLENVRSYKYLGLIFTPSGELKTALSDLRSRALKAYMNLRDKLGKHFNTHIEDVLKLFDSIIRPILLYSSDFWGCLNLLIRPTLLYSSDFWGCLNLPKNKPIENHHFTFCKHLLGVQKGTTNVVVLLELGRTPLTLDAQKAAIKN